MQLSSPKMITFVIAVVLGVLGILGAILPIPFVTTYAIWFVAAGFVLLAVGSAAKGI